MLDIIVIQDRWDSGHVGCRTGECRTGSIWSGGMQERRDSIDDRFKFGCEKAQIRKDERKGRIWD